MSEEQKPPVGHIRLAVDNGPKDRVMAAFEALRMPLLDLTANIMRTARGAGKPALIPEHCIAVLEAVQSYRDEVGSWPRAADMTEILANWQDVGYNRDPLVDECERAILEMMRSSLRIIAARMLQEDLQEANGDRDMWRALDRFERVRREQEKAAEQLLSTTKRRGSTKTKKPKRTLSDL